MRMTPATPLPLKPPRKTMIREVVLTNYGIRHEMFTRLMATKDEHQRDDGRCNQHQYDDDEDEDGVGEMPSTLQLLLKDVRVLQENILYDLLIDDPYGVCVLHRLVGVGLFVDVDVQPT